MTAMQNVQELLNSVSRKINEKGNQKIAQDERGERFNVFSLCGVDHYEVMHSRILAEFLNPKGTHGQSDGKFLAAFFKMLLPPEFASKFDRKTVVRTEECAKMGGLSIGRLDIFIENSANKVVCIIENKIFAGEQPEQLSRYSKWLEEKSKDGFETCLIFLTLDGHESGTIRGKEYKLLAYWNRNKGASPSNDIISWLGECRQIACEKPFVRETLGQYQNHIENIINGGQIMREDVKKLLIGNVANLKAAQWIYEAYCASRDAKAEMLFKKFCFEYNYNYDKDGAFNSARKEAGHAILLKTANGKEFKVSVCFENTGLVAPFIGICIGDNKALLEGVLPERWKEEISKKANQSVEWYSPTKSWPMWRYIGTCMECPNWDGEFFAKIEEDENSRNNYFQEMYKTIEVIREVVCEILLQ